VFAAIEAARAAGGKVSFDPNLRLSLWPLARARATICATMALTDLFLPSLDEAVALAGTEDVAAIFAWARSHGARTVVLKAGPSGAWYAEPGAEPQLAASRPVQAVDATGAGDCFDGSLLAASPPAIRWPTQSATPTPVPACPRWATARSAPIPTAASARGAGLILRFAPKHTRS
jgi:2-dehydro-3-deoxygluconokinase